MMQKMKESGIEWIGKIPEHWEIKKIKRESTVIRGQSPRPIDDPKYFDNNGFFSWVRISDVTASKGLLKGTEQKLSELGASLGIKLQPGEIFLSIAASVGKPCITTIPCCIHDGFVYFPQLKMSRKFLYYIFEAGECYQGLGKVGTQLNLNSEIVGNIQIPIPPRMEQEALVAFLDIVVEKIDSYIIKRQRVLELLQEIRQATINQIVTKGLDPNVLLKESGIEWIGKIPEHWKVVAIKRILDVPITDGLHETPSILSEGMPFVSAEAVKNGKIDLDYARFISFEDYKKFIKKCKPQRDDIFLVKSGNTTGKVAIVDIDIEFCVWSPLALIRINKYKHQPKFFYYFIQSDSFQNQVHSTLSWGTQPNIGMNVIKDLMVVIPSKEEQENIARHLEKMQNEIRALINQISLQINKLHEYRQSIISAAVTGKVDLRNKKEVLLADDRC